jgi:hypothetical protein
MLSKKSLVQSFCRSGVILDDHCGRGVEVDATIDT